MWKKTLLLTTFANFATLSEVDISGIFFFHKSLQIKPKVVTHVYM